MRGPGKNSYSESLLLHGSAPTDPIATGLGGKEKGVTLQERGGAGSRSGRRCGSREGEFNLHPPTLDAIISSPSPHPHICIELRDAQTTLVHSCSGPFPVASRQRYGPRRGPFGCTLRAGEGRRGLGVTCRPSLPRRWPDASAPTPTRVPGARTPAAVQTVFVY